MSSRPARAVSRYFKHGDSSKTLQNRPLKNPNYKEGSTEKATYLSVLIENVQGVCAGSIHPNGQEYVCLQDLSLAEIGRKELEWLQSLWLDAKKANKSRTAVNQLRSGVNIAEQLAAHGLKFHTKQVDVRTLYLYHAEMGKCLVKGAAHHPANPEQCCFIHNRDTQELVHFCLSDGCKAVFKSTEKALAAIGLSLPELVIEPWELAFRGPRELDRTPLVFLVENFIPEEAATAIAGLSGHYKSWIALSLAKALINGPGKLWNEFDIRQQANVLYLTPEVGDKSLLKRLVKLGMDDYPREKFIARSFSMGATLDLDSKEVQRAAKGRVVFLDTTICFVEGDENLSSANKEGLRESVIGLLINGARAVILLQHSPKGFAKEDFMTLENVLRGSGDIGAMLGASYGVKVIDRDQGLVHVECIKPRDFEGPKPFQIALAYSDDPGDFIMIGRPGEIGNLAAQGEKQKAKKDAVIAAIKTGKSVREIKKLGVSQKTIDKWRAELSIPEQTETFEFPVLSEQENSAPF